MSADDGIKIVAKNKKARHEYFILDTFEAGIVLQGTEVKSIRAGRLNFLDSYVNVRNGELWLIGMHISPYDQGNIHNHEPARNRKLLMHGREIDRIRKQTEEKGLTVVPLSVYFKRGVAKVEIAIVRGKHLYDKRRDEAKRDARREMDRAQKSDV